MLRPHPPRKQAWADGTDVKSKLPASPLANQRIKSIRQHQHTNHPTAQRDAALNDQSTAGALFWSGLVQSTFKAGGVLLTRGFRHSTAKPEVLGLGLGKRVILPGEAAVAPAECAVEGAAKRAAENVIDACAIHRVPLGNAPVEFFDPLHSGVPMLHAAVIHIDRQPSTLTRRTPCLALADEHQDRLGELQVELAEIVSSRFAALGRAARCPRLIVVCGGTVRQI